MRNLPSMELPYHADQVDWPWDLVPLEEPLIQDGKFVVLEGPALAHVKAGYEFFGEGV